MSVPSIMPFSVELGDSDVSRLELVQFRRNVNWTKNHRVAHLRNDLAIYVGNVNENLVGFCILAFGLDEPVALLPAEVSDDSGFLRSVGGSLAGGKRAIPTRRHQMR